jgi:Fic family protein
MAQFDPTRSHNGLPPLPPPLERVETAKILKKCINARVALAELRQAAELIPNPAVLVNALPLLEARASSAIENIVTTTDKLFEFVDTSDNRADPATKEALRYRTALFEGTRAVRRDGVTAATAIDVCRRIKDEALDLRADSGTSLKSHVTATTIYTPPEGRALIEEQLDNWEEFLRADTELDPLIRVAIQHYQFEAIHPFADGNGRTGRILNVLYLVDQHLLDNPILYLSRYILRNKAEYYRRLLEVTTDGAWEQWILYILDGIEDTCLWTTGKIRATRELMRHTTQLIRTRLPKIYTRELAELLFMQPCCRIANVVDAGLAQRQTASVYLKELVKLGILEEVKSGRESLFVHPKYIELLTGDENVWVYYAGVETEAAIDREAG